MTLTWPLLARRRIVVGALVGGGIVAAQGLEAALLAAAITTALSGLLSLRIRERVTESIIKVDVA
jgi:hypothetical protein